MGPVAKWPPRFKAEGGLRCGQERRAIIAVLASYQAARLHT